MCKALTGQVDVYVAPMVMVQVIRKGSVLDAFMQRLAAAGMKVRSVWRSVDAGSKVFEDGEQNSLALRKS